MKTQIQQPKAQETVQPKAENQASVSDIISGYGNNVAQREVIQREERKTTIYAKDGQTWKKNMEIIDSASASNYVHLSRSTTSDPESFPIAGAKANALDRDGSRGTKVENTDDAYDRSAFTAGNNAHITLEGRYVDVLQSIVDMGDNSRAIKSGPPVSDKYANLNYGPGVQISRKGIEQYITETATKATNYVLDNNIGFFPDATNEQNLERRDEITGGIDAVMNSTLEFTTQLIASTPYLKGLDDRSELVHYGGAAWRPDFKKE